MYGKVTRVYTKRVCMLTSISNILSSFSNGFTSTSFWVMFLFALSLPVSPICSMTGSRTKSAASLRTSCGQVAVNMMVCRSGGV